MRKFLFAFCLFLSWHLHAQLHVPDARVAAMGGAGITNSNAWSAYFNPAGLADFKQFSASVHVENNFFTQNALLRAATISYPTEFGTFAAYYSYYGFDAYNENKISLVYGKKLGKYLRAGIALDYFGINLAAPYRGTNAITGELGLQADLSKKWLLAVHFFNPFFAKYSHYDDFYLPVVYKLGTSYQFSPDFLLIAEMEKNLGNKEQFKVGAEYRLVPQVFVRAGFRTEVFVYTFGVGFKNKRMSADMGFENHPQLGYTIKLSYTYSIFDISE